MKGLSSPRFFRRVTAVLTAVGLGLLGLALALPTAPMALTLRIIVGSLGALLLLVALLGPLRIGLSPLELPAEVKRAMKVNGACLAVFALAAVGAAARGDGGTTTLAIAVAGLALLGSAWLGMFPLTRQLPDSFSLGELLSIAKSTGAMGFSRQSTADDEFRRWTSGREGLPIGAPAPDAEVLTLEGETLRLSSLLPAEDDPAPVVLNFGSYTCPHHRKRVEELHALIDEWTPLGVRFLTVYVNEAHPEDGWRLEGQYQNDPEYTGNPEDFCFFRARELNERVRMARWLVDKKQLRMPVVVDRMDDALMRAYNAWPIRLYIVKQGRVVFTGDQGPFGYSPAAVGERLDALTKPPG
ncbi:MAG: deiodinase-like protein [Enhygromyxa sp.]